MNGSGGVPLAVGRSRVRDWIEMGKIRITSMVVFSTAVGYFLGSGGRVEAAVLGWTLAGVALVSAGASILNMVWERDTDAKMRRTQHRPIPAGRIGPLEAQAVGVLAVVAGLVALEQVVIPAAALAALSVAIYVFVYTPAKRVWSLSIAVGGIAGALPPVVGWVVGHGHLAPEAAALFAILYMWQLPHFLAIGWLYREDYARAKLPTLAVLDPSGASTARQIVVQAVGLVAVSVVPTAMGWAGPVYAAAAFVLGGMLLAAVAGFAQTRSDRWARRVFLTSNVYLPLLLGVLVIPGM